MKPHVLVALGLSATLALSGCSADPDDSATPDPAAASDAGTTGEPTLDGTSMPPWPAPVDVPARVAQAGLDLGPMGTAEHYHPRLHIVIDGREVPVPPNIGVDPATGAMSAVHTHEGDGTIHIEADTEGEVFTLGQLFTQWGVKLSDTQVGGVKAEPGERVQVTSNGQEVTGDPMDLQLEPDQQIVLTLG